MICPHCGYEMGIKSKCIRCGYEVKTLAVVDTDAENEEPKSKAEDKVETKIIDPCNVYLTHPYGYEDDYGTGFGPFGDPFGSLFGEIFGDPIGDLLGGLFGIDLNPRRQTRKTAEEPHKKKRKQGPIVEVSEVEVLDENGNPVNENKSKAQHASAHDTKSKTHKNPFKRNNGRK